MNREEELIIVVLELFLVLQWKTVKEKVGQMRWIGFDHVLNYIPFLAKRFIINSYLLHI